MKKNTENLSISFKTYGLIEKLSRLARIIVG